MAFLEDTDTVRDLDQRDVHHGLGDGSNASSKQVDGLDQLDRRYAGSNRFLSHLLLSVGNCLHGTVSCKATV